MVTVFELTVVRGVLLDSVIGQMDILVIQRRAVGGILTGTRPYVPFSEKEAVVIVVDQNPNSDIKLTAVNKKRVLDVFLNDKLGALDLVLLLLYLNLAHH